MRKDAREVVFKMLYATTYSDYDESLFMELCHEFSLTSQEIDFAKNLYETIISNKQTLDQILEELAKNYKLDRVYVTDKCALYIGLGEMTYFKDVPSIVAIDEALSLCRKYSTKDSVNFANGIMAEYKKRLENA